MWNLSGKSTGWGTVQQYGNPNHVIRFRSIHIFGLGESHVEEKLPGIIDRKRIPKVGITATQGTITLRIAAQADTEAECLAKMQPTVDWIYKTLGEHIFGENDDTLESVVSKKLQHVKKTLAVAEAGTRGLLTERLAHVQGNDMFLGGLVLPQRKPATAEEMLKAARRMFDADYVLVIGNYPQGIPDRSRSDEVFVAVLDNRATDIQKSVLSQERYPFAGHPAVIDDLFIKRVLDNFRRLIEIA
jgi:nicotinamide-nucleotide amidase